MLNRNDGEPLTVSQTLTEKDFSAAAEAIRYFASPMRRRSIRVAACLTVAALAGSMIPASLNLYRTVWVPSLVAALAVAAAAAVWFGQPVLERRKAKTWFRSCPLMALPAKMTVFRDRVILESECERITEYWTDFSICVETKNLIVVSAGQERGLLIAKKQGLPEEEAARFSARFHYAFEGRYFHYFRKGGV